MRAWQDTGARRRWAAAPSSPPVGDSKAATRIGAFDMDREDDGNRSVNLSGNPKGGRKDRCAEEEKEHVKLRAPGNETLGRD
jgi:hypothetical protein